MSSPKSSTVPSSSGKRFVGTVDLTPEWKGLLPALIELAAQGQRPAREELYRLADFADRVGPHFPKIIEATRHVLEELAKGGAVSPEKRDALVAAVAAFDAAEAGKAKSSNDAPLPQSPGSAANGQSR